MLSFLFSPGASLCRILSSLSQVTGILCIGSLPVPREARGLRACLRGSSWLSACPAGGEPGRFPRAVLRGSMGAQNRLPRRCADTGPPAPGSGQRDTAAASAAEREIPMFKRQLAAPIIKAEVKRFFWLWSLLFLPLIFFFFFSLLVLIGTLVQLWVMLDTAC